MKYQPNSPARSSTDYSESQRLVWEKMESGESDSLQNNSPLRRFFTCGRIYAAVLHLVILGLVVQLWKNRSTGFAALEGGRSWSPIDDFVQYELKRHMITDKPKTNFAGVPTEETDKAWDDLMSSVHFNATRQELIQAGESLDNIAELRDGGYLATIGVYHELHCLRQLRMYVYHDHYYHNVTESQTVALKKHLDHCVDTLRETLMCSGNTDVYSFYWDDTGDDIPATQSNAVSVCKNWDLIAEWARSRVPANRDLQHP